MVKGAREGARVEIMSGPPIMCGSGELSGSPRNREARSAEATKIDLNNVDR